MDELTNKKYKISISEDIYLKAIKVQKDLKLRGANVKIDELFSDLLMKADEAYWKAQQDRHTPEDYLFDLAKEHPEVRAYLIKYAKRAFDKVERGENLDSGMRRGRKPKTNHSEQSF